MTEKMARIAFLGPKGTYSQEALTRCPWANGAELMPVPSIPDVIWAVAEGKAEAGLVPTENSLEGAINVSLDMLVHKVDLFIKYEVALPIRCNLLAKSGISLDRIEAVYSHPQPLAQCREFLQEKLPKAAIFSTDSTTKAVQIVKDCEENFAAIGTKLAGELYGLECIAQNIQDSEDNHTRFLLLTKTDHSPTGKDKTSIAFAQDKDRPGGLYSIMSEFALRNINLTRIESRPSRKMLGEYIFFLDFIGHREDCLVQEALQAAKEKTTFLKILGSYPQYSE